MRQAILDTLKVDNGRTIIPDGKNTATVASAICKSRPTAAKWLAILEAEGKIKHYDIGRSKLWFIVNKP